MKFNRNIYIKAREKNSLIKIIAGCHRAEKHHNEPHFHISNPDGTNIVIYFKDFEQHQGKVPVPSDDKIINEWLSNSKNKDFLIELWNYYHPEQLVKVSN